MNIQPTLDYKDSPEQQDSVSSDGAAVRMTDASPAALESSFYAMEETYIKLYRGVIDSWVWERGDHLKIWLYLLLKANYADRKMISGKGTVKVKRGQLLRSLSKIADDCRLSVQNVRTFLDIAEADGALTRQVTQYGTLITICNYSGYQDGEKQTNTPTNTRLTRAQHAPNTRLTHGQHAPNNVIRREEGKKDRRKEVYTPLTPLTGGVLDYPEFLAAWSDWTKHLAEIKKPLTPTRAAKQLQKMQQLKEQGEDPVAVINASIANGWQGLFPPKQENKPNIPTQKEVEDYIRSWWPDRTDGTNPEIKWAREFFRHYSAQGWYLANKLPMLNWKAKAYEWVNNARNQQ